MLVDLVLFSSHTRSTYTQLFNVFLCCLLKHFYVAFFCCFLFFWFYEFTSWRNFVMKRILNSKFKLPKNHFVIVSTLKSTLVTTILLRGLWIQECSVLRRSQCPSHILCKLSLFSLFAMQQTRIRSRRPSMSLTVENRISLSFPGSIISKIDCKLNWKMVCLFA